MEWPELDTARDSGTWRVLHLASQMLGKLRVRHADWVNHGWHVALQPSANGLASLPIAAEGGRFSLSLDLCDHRIHLLVSDGRSDSVPLAQPSIARLHADLIAMLDRNGLPSDFHGRPNELPDAVPFAEDDRLSDYREESAVRLREVLRVVVPVFETFRAGFSGKVSPVHFWWGSFDLAVTRFSGRRAPDHPGGVPGLPDRITREAYSHEVSSAGFWPGGAFGAAPIFYSYAYPSPDGFSAAAVSRGRFDEALGEFVLPYGEVRSQADPAGTLLTFLQETYAAAADLAQWDRAALERDPVAP
ncbi:hypothetical protein GGQ97_000691 [Sphingomonas kaistensis]|uniref:Ava_C0101 and related proteins n=1 Tax=Sphingomonas kaistensis TaxID=298708 RepID=A0A7X6BFK1_9SPHN|nr:DUF5996 family protein [Sphingomonas kaistensis]NJC04898.1 hypothetical protein [Sphingomonas kaistensis]